MYFVLLLVYVYVFYIKFFNGAINLLRNKNKNYSFNQKKLPVVIEHDMLKGKRCNNQIVKLSRKSINCESLCGGSYMKKTLNNKNNGLDPGIYCVPRELDSCHPYTGKIVKNAHGWTCISKYPFVFSGADADEIVACNGKLIDRLSDSINYIGRIPRDVKVLDNPDIEKLKNGDFRFVCPDQRDNMNNRYVSTDVSRLHTVRNVCAQMLVNDNDRSIPDFENGKCNCNALGHGEYIDSRTGPYCAPKTTQQYFYEPCLKSNNTTNEMLKPCGVLTYDNSTGSSLYKYEIDISTNGLSSKTSQDLEKDY